MEPGTRPGPCQVRLGAWPTPLQRLDNLGGYYVKREDLCGFAFGGTKVRAVEPLLRDALTSGASSLVTGGRRDSNWAALAAVGAAWAGLSCHCVYDPGPGIPLAMRLAARAGATLHVAPGRGPTAVNAAITALAAELGPSAYPVPRAGAAPSGVAGYRALARELAWQLPPGPADIVLPIGSGGACAGLLLGFGEPPPDGGGRDIRIVGVPAGKSAAEATAAVQRLLTQAGGADALLGRLLVLPRAEVRSPLADRLAACSGVLLDPVFAGPAWHTFCARQPQPAAWDQRSVVLVASGGLPAYFDALNAGGDTDAGGDE
jgi:D-cysteine desulfhydrase